MCAEKFLLQNETNKISNAQELVDAIFSNGGPKNTKMCVIKIDKTLAALTNVKKITNISYYHSVDFQPSGALYREYYNIGEGKFHEYNGICKTFFFRIKLQKIISQIANSKMGHHLLQIG